MKVVSWTGSGNYPPYLTASVEAGIVRIVVRSAAAIDNYGSSPGSQAAVEIRVAEFKRIVEDLGVGS